MDDVYGKSRVDPSKCCHFCWAIMAYNWSGQVVDVIFDV